MIVSTSPLLKGRSCSDVPLKLYLATHSVPCGHGIYSDVGRWKNKKRFYLCVRVYPRSDMHRRLYFTGLSYLGLCHGEAVRSSHRWGFLAATMRAGKHTQTCDTCEEEKGQCAGRSSFADIRFNHKQTQPRKWISGFSARGCMGSSKPTGQSVSHGTRAPSDSGSKNNSLIQKAEMTSLLFLNHTFTTATERFHDVGQQCVKTAALSASIAQ